eukprot:6612467-Pyramimonas_sp.AAC.1
MSPTLVSWPAYTTMPEAHSVFLKLDPRSSTWSGSQSGEARGYILTAGTNPVSHGGIYPRSSTWSGSQSGEARE